MSETILLLNLSLETAFWVALGTLFGRAFAKPLDHYVQDSGWFAQMPLFAQWFLRRALDLLHHWWVGVLLYLYAPQLPLAPGTITVLQYFGIGILLNDLPSVPERWRGYFGTFLGGAKP